jgi:hypothetical protein
MSILPRNDTENPGGSSDHGFGLSILSASVGSWARGDGRRLSWRKDMILSSQISEPTKIIAAHHPLKVSLPAECLSSRIPPSWYQFPTLIIDYKRIGEDVML